MTDAERLQMTRERNAQIRAEREAREAAAAQKLIDDAWARLARYGEKHGFAPADLLAACSCSTMDDLVEFAARQRTTPSDLLTYQLYDARLLLTQRRDRDQIQADRERRAAEHGGRVCKRCGGEGGHHGWPGFTCYDCDGRGYTIA